MNTHCKCKPLSGKPAIRVGMDCQSWHDRLIWCSVFVHGTIASPFPFRTKPNKLQLIYQKKNEFLNEKAKMKFSLNNRQLIALKKGVKILLFSQKEICSPEIKLSNRIRQEKRVNNKSKKKKICYESEKMFHWKTSFIYWFASSGGKVVTKTGGKKISLSHTHRFRRKFIDWMKDGWKHGKGIKVLYFFLIPRIPKCCSSRLSQTERTNSSSSSSNGGTKKCDWVLFVWKSNFVQLRIREASTKHNHIK